jgi:YidC/Oxa1 family membrane protein insertase
VQDTVATTAAADPSAPPLEPSPSTTESISSDPIDPVFVDPRADPASASDITYIGQMHDLGLDFGWGPSSCMQWLTEHIHVYGGMPWYGTIIATAVVVRLSMSPLVWRQTKTGQRLRLCSPRLTELRTKFAEHNKNNDKIEATKTAKEMGRLSKVMGSSPASMIATPVIQGVLGFGAFRLLRNMADLPVPGLEDGGFLWLWNLTVPDPLYVLPIAQGLCMYLMARVGIDSFLVWHQFDKKR